jgi:molybdopterin-synthase adenylyltransferase
MKPIFISISEKDWARVRSALFTEDGNENAGVLLCGASEGASEFRLLVRQFLPVQSDLYSDRNDYHLEVSPRFYNQVVDECLRRKLTPVIVHSHPHHQEAWYSKSDDFGETRLIPVLQSLLPGTVPRSLVITPSSVVGRTFRDGKFTFLDGLKIFGRKSQIVVFSRKEKEHISAIYERQVRAFGAEGQKILHTIKIGVVGLGGTGSLVVEQLSRIGVQDLVLIDNDIIEESNLARVFGSSAASKDKRKVDIAARHARSLGTATIQTVFESAIRQEVLLKLRDRDLIFSCVDNDRTRAVLNRFSHQYLIPVVDLGTRLDGRGGQVRASAGRVAITGYGMTCMRCSHFLNPERIRAESLPRQEREALQKEGYVMGIDEAAPAIVSLNAVVAGLGVTGGINLFVNLTGAAQPLAQHYDATTGTVFASAEVHESGCDVCDEVEGVKALGDLQVVSAYD